MSCLGFRLTALRRDVPCSRVNPFLERFDVDFEGRDGLDVILGHYPGVILRCVLLRMTDLELVSEAFHVIINLAYTVWTLAILNFLL